MWIVSSDRRVIYVLCSEFQPQCKFERLNIWQEIVENKLH